MNYYPATVERPTVDAPHPTITVHRAQRNPDGYAGTTRTPTRCGKLTRDVVSALADGPRHVTCPDCLTRCRAGWPDTADYRVHAGSWARGTMFACPDHGHGPSRFETSGEVEL